MKCVVRVSCSVALTLCVAHQATAGWFDSATGQPVQTIPLTSDPNNPTGNVRRDDPDHATVGGKNLYRDKACGTWRDSATGKEVRTIPLTSDPNNPTGNVRRDDPD